MAQIKASATVEGRVTLHLTETEAAALDAITGYGVEPFLKVFYAQMGKHYLQPHEAGVKSLFDTVRRDVPHALDRFKAARLAFMLPNPGAVGPALRDVIRRADAERVRVAEAELRSREKPS